MGVGEGATAPPADDALMALDLGTRQTRSGSSDTPATGGTRLPIAC